jgi:small nuclear ribonucleoprotein (snRNP)-like protein
MLAYGSTQQSLRSSRAGDSLLAFSHEKKPVNIEMPLFKASSAMAVGFPVFLVTDFELSFLTDEFALLDWLQQRIPLKIVTLFQVNDHLNAVLQSATGQRFRVTLREADLESEGGKGMTEMEQQVLELLREPKFDCLIIQLLGGGYPFEIECDYAASSIQGVMCMLKEHQYQPVTVKTQGGKIIRIAQSVLVIPSQG